MGDDLVKYSSEENTITVNKSYCKGCEICVEFCPVNVFEMSEEITDNGYHYSVPERVEDCIDCKQCELMCPDFAIKVNEEEK